MATITAKQRAARKVTQTVFIPLATAVELDEAAKQLGISRNKLINYCVIFGLKYREGLIINDNKNIVPSGLEATNQTPRAAAPLVLEEAVTTTPTPHKESNQEEAEVSS